MENIDNKKGLYPGLEGILKLLRSLITTAGCPADLGSTSRIPGCSPYLSFVTTIIAWLLEMKSPKRIRLISRAAEVVHSAISLLSPTCEQRLEAFSLIQDSLFIQREDITINSRAIAELQPALDLLIQYFITAIHDDNCMVDSDMKAVAIALFGDLVPSYPPVKVGRESLLRASQSDVGTLFASSIPHGLSHSMVKSLQPPTTESDDHFMASSDDDNAWKEYFILLNLRIFSYIAYFSRESEKRIIHGAPVISRFVAHRSVTLTNEYEISATAVCLLLHISKQLPQRKFVVSLCGSTGPEYLTRVFVKCLSWENINGELHILHSLKVQLVSLLINSITDVQNDVEDSLAHAVMGLTGWSLSRQTQALIKPFSKRNLNDFSPYHNILDEILNIISDSSSLSDQSSAVLVSKSFEFLYRFLSTESQSSMTQSWSLAKQCVVAKLQLVGFWEKTLTALGGSFNTIISNLYGFQSSSHDYQHLKKACTLFHCISWTLKCLCIEYRSVHNSDIIGYGGPWNLQGIFNTFLAIYDGLLDVMNRTVKFSPIQDVIEAMQIQGSIPLEQLEGPFDVCSGFQTINIQKLSDFLLKQPSHGEEKIGPYIRWANDWNVNVEFACASSHLSKTSAVFIRVIILIGYHRGTVGTNDILSLLNILLNKAKLFQSAPLAPQVLSSLSSTVFWLVGQIISISECDSQDVLSLIHLILHVIGLYETPDGLLDECVAILSCALSALILHFWPTLSTLSFLDVVDLEPTLRNLEKISVSGHGDNLAIRKCTRSALSCLTRLMVEGKE